MQQVQLQVFLAYLRAVGMAISIAILLLYILTNVCQIYANVWLSQWSNDLPNSNGTMDTAQRDMRLGVYGGLGLAQGLCI